MSKAAALGWAEAQASAENAAPATKAICPMGMRCFQNELHHVRILNDKRYKSAGKLIKTRQILPQLDGFLSGQSVRHLKEIDLTPASWAIENEILVG